jgi:hypothetical protein
MDNQMDRCDYGQTEISSKNNSKTKQHKFLAATATQEVKVYFETWSFNQKIKSFRGAINIKNGKT